MIDNLEEEVIEKNVVMFGVNKTILFLLKQLMYAYYNDHLLCESNFVIFKNIL